MRGGSEPLEERVCVCVVTYFNAHVMYIEPTLRENSFDSVEVRVTS